MNMYRCIKLVSTCVFFGLASLASAQEEESRVWTNKDGRKITAKMIKVNPDGKVLILLKGKEIALALETLSDADNEYVTQWQKEREERDKKRAAQSTMFAGKQLKTGGAKNIFKFDYGPEILAIAKNLKATDTGYRIAITVPEGFDSRKPQKVFILANAKNSKGQSRLGNINAIHNFNKTTTAEGWVCIAYDSNLGNDVNHILAWHAAMKKFSEEWPDFNSWIFACGGNSGGAKGAMLHTIFHLEHKRNVRGLFLSSCNQATNLPLARKHHKVNKSALKDTRCLISSNSKTTKVTPADVDRVKSTIKGEGLRTIRVEWHQGAAGIYQDHFAEALRWFAQEKP